MIVERTGKIKNKWVDDCKDIGLTIYKQSNDNILINYNMINLASLIGQTYGDFRYFLDDGRVIFDNYSSRYEYIDIKAFLVDMLHTMMLDDSVDWKTEVWCILMLFGSRCDSKTYMDAWKYCGSRGMEVLENV